MSEDEKPAESVRPPRDAALEAALAPEAHEKSAADGAERDLFGKPPPKGHKDWSHRKGEPRMLAFLWCVVLLAATLLTFFIAGSGGLISPSSYRAAARGMLLVITLGLTVAWPVIRLSQNRPRGESGPVLVLKDLAVLLVPVQAVIWTQYLIAGWSVSVLGAFTLGMIAWALVAGGLIALAVGPAQRRPSPVPAAWFWALVLGGVILAAPAYLLSRGVIQGELLHEAPGWLRMASPLTMVHELLQDRAGQGVIARVDGEHWRAIGFTAAGAGLAWVVSIGLALAKRPSPA